MQVSCAHPSVWPTRVTESLHGAHSQQTDAQSRVRLTRTFLLTPLFSVTPTQEFTFYSGCVHQRGQLLWSWVTGGCWELDSSPLQEPSALSCWAVFLASTTKIFLVSLKCLLNLFINEYFSLKFYWVYFNYLFKTLSIRSDIIFRKICHWFVNPRCCLT